MPISLLTAGMSWCSEWIRDWLNTSGKNQGKLAELAGIDPGNVSRWLSGQSKPDREAITALIDSLDEDFATGLLVAWLKDALPDGSEHLVHIAPAPERAMVKEEHRRTEGAFPAGMSSELRQRLVFFGKLAVANPDLRKIVDVCYEAAMRAQSESQT
jgi:transcriptional regulator with XRE-family HTH domain